MRLSTEETITEYWQSVYAIALSICKNQMDAEDIAQETFVKYHMYKKQFDDKEHIRAWLFRVTINLARNSIKSFWKKNKISFEEYLKNNLLMEEKDIIGDVALSYEKKESSIELTRAVFALPEKYRIIIHLYYYEEYSCREIAIILSVAEATVRKRLSRGRDMLRNVLSEELCDD